MVFNFDKEAYSTGLLLPTKLEKAKQGYQVGPPWLRPLLTAQFFTNCETHGDNNRNERNLYCLDCRGEALCSACTAQHRDHHVVQIRRSSYHDVVRVSELQKVLDLTGVQTYIINSAKVVFLNARPQPRHAKGVTKTCEICDRSLLDTNRYCSLGCKLTGIRRHNDMTFHLQPKNEQHQQHQQQHQSKNNTTNTNTATTTEDDKLIDSSNISQRHILHVVHSAPAPSAVKSTGASDTEEQTNSDQHLAPAVPAPARSSITSEDTGSSGGVHSASSGKRTRSSRRTGASSPLRGTGGGASPPKSSTEGKTSSSPQQRNRRSGTTTNSPSAAVAAVAAAGAAGKSKRMEDSVAEKISPLAEPDKEDMLSLEVQKSLGTLKLGTRGATSHSSPCVSMEVDESPTSVSSAAARLTSELSPPTPPPTRTAKRRKGVPHRAPFGL